MSFTQRLVAPGSEGACLDGVKETLLKLGKVSITVQVVNTVMPFVMAGRPKAQHETTIRKSA